MAGPVLGHDRVPPVLDDPGGVVTQELVAADRGSLIEARRPKSLRACFLTWMPSMNRPPTPTWGWLLPA